MTPGRKLGLGQSSRDQATKIFGGRKVRAPQDMVVDNVHRPQGSGKCNRKETAWAEGGRDQGVGSRDQCSAGLLVPYSLLSDPYPLFSRKGETVR